MDVQSITSVNSKWIFSGSMIRDKASIDTLREIYQTAMIDAAFYERMYKEVSARIDREREKLKARHCPTKEEIDRAPNWSTQCDLQRERTEYIKNSDAIGGMYDILSDTFQKQQHCKKLIHQARIALEGV